MVKSDIPPSDNPAEQTTDKHTPPVSRERQRFLKEENGGDMHLSNSFLDGGEMDDWLAAENEIDHFLHSRQ